MTEQLAVLQVMLDHYQGFHVANLDPEILIPRDPPPMRLLPYIFPTLLVIEDVLDEFETDLYHLEITSAYRSPGYNTAVGGSPHSLHRSFNAIDFKVRDVPAANVQAFLKVHNLANYMGIGDYETFTHVDTRGLIGRNAPARWTG